jgi:phosphatidylserine decarboxylase
MATTHIPRRSGWLPPSHVMKKWYQHQIKNLPNFTRPWNDVITEFKNLIESDPDIYMGFNMMFEQTKDLYDPTGAPQVSDMFFRTPSPND